MPLVLSRRAIFCYACTNTVTNCRGECKNSLVRAILVSLSHFTRKIAGKNRAVPNIKVRTVEVRALRQLGSVSMHEGLTT